MIKINSNKLKEMLGKLSNCSTNKLLEITKYYYIQNSKDRLFTITATDGTNYITVTDTNKSDEEFEAIVKADQFSKLVERTSVDTITLDMKETHLEVIGNGKYKVEVVIGEIYPEYEFDVDDENCECTEFSVKDIRTVDSVNCYSRSVNMSDGFLTGYYLGEKAITADGVKVCVTPVNIMQTPILITQDLLNLVTTVNDELCTVYYMPEQNEGQGKLLFLADGIEIFGTVMEGIDEYPNIDGLMETKFTAHCELSKLSVLNVLDRLTLFIDPFEKNETVLDFTKEGLQFSTTTGSYEILSYISSKAFKEFHCSINVQFFKELITAVETEKFIMYYGNTDFIKLESNGVTQLLALGEED